jgi:Fe-S-cluster containining protein
MDEKVRRRVLEIYREADAAVKAAGPVCVASGRCCRFREYGHVLYLSNLEADVLLAAAPAFDQRSVTADFCPFQKDNLCTAREPRPLGCRVYFCDPAYQDKMAEITERYLRKLKTVAEEQGMEWEYGPLHRFLGLIRHRDNEDHAEALAVTLQARTR